MELICPAGTPASFRDAMDAGADAIYCGFRNETNARNFPGLNFSTEELEKAADEARNSGIATFVAINTFMRAGSEDIWFRAIDDAVQIGATAIILADIGLMAYAAEKYPEQRLHLSVQASASNADTINYLVDTLGIKRAVLPRVLTLADVASVTRNVRCETEVFVFGGLCVMAEGRCSLSSYATGKSPNMHGVCSPASHVRYRHDGDELVSELGAFTINRFADAESAGYPTLCKGRFTAGDQSGYIFEDPVSLDALSHLDELKAAGVSALKIEGRQRGRAYIAETVRTIRQAIAASPGDRQAQIEKLRRFSEGQQTTSGAYEKRWR